MEETAENTQRYVDFCIKNDCFHKISPGDFLEMKMMEYPGYYVFRLESLEVQMLQLQGAAPGIFIPNYVKKSPIIIRKNETDSK